MTTEEEIMSEVVEAVEPAPKEPTDEPNEAETEEDSLEEVQEFELPDGRKVDAKGLEEEYNKLLPEFTRRSQRLAALEKIKETPKETEKATWEDPNWQPKTWQEVRQAAREETLRELQPLLSEVEQRKLQADVYTQAQQIVDTELAALKAKDSKLNEAELFKHANKGFNSLTAAYNDLQDRKGLEKAVEQRVLKNMKSRGEEPVANSSATTPENDVPVYQDLTKFRNSRDAAFAALKAQK